MRIERHWIHGIDRFPAHYTGRVITPEIVVLHDTAGRLDKFSSARYLASDNSGKASAHFVIERDGQVVQLVPTNRKANHAGRSSYHGRTGCNGFSIGIEIVNPGKMRSIGSKAKAWYGRVFDEADGYELESAGTEEHGSGTWMGYAEAQMTALIDLLETLFRDIPTLRDITTHWYVSPGRKVDTNPLFPLEHVRARILGRDDPADMEAEEGSIPPPEGDELVQIDTPGDALNMRRWPSFNPNVVLAIPDGTVVPVIRKGTFAGCTWLRVLYGGQEGWVVARYTAHVALAGDT